MDPILPLSSTKKEKEAENRHQSEHHIKPIEECVQELRDLGLSTPEVRELGDILKKLMECLIREKFITQMI